MGQIGQNWAQNLFFSLFFYFDSIVFLEITYDDSLEHCLTNSRGKPHGKISGAPNWVRNQGFCHFLKVASFVFLDIAQDCSLGQCLPSGRSKTSEKRLGPNWDQNDFYVVMLLRKNCNVMLFRKKLQLKKIVFLFLSKKKVHPFSNRPKQPFTGAL